MMLFYEYKYGDARIGMNTWTKTILTEHDDVTFGQWEADEKVIEWLNERGISYTTLDTFDAWDHNDEPTWFFAALRYPSLMTQEQEDALAMEVRMRWV